MAQIFSDMVEIDAGCDRVWNLLVGIDGWSTWRNGLVDVTVLSEPVFGTGFKWREIRLVEGKEVTFDIEVTDHADLESLSLIVHGDKSGHGRHLAFFEYRVIDFDSTTTVHLDSKREKRTGLKSLLSKSPIDAFVELHRTDLMRLKDCAEKTG